MTAPAHVRPRPAALRRGGLRAGTGVPVIDARADFQRARRAEILARALRGLPTRRGGSAALPAWDAVSLLASTGRDLRVIPLQAIVGTVDATPDFGAAFRPATNRVAERWQRVALAHRRGHARPPITVVERSDGYYVVDGRHRVSDARALGQTDIEARVGQTLRPRAEGTAIPLDMNRNHHAPIGTRHART